MLINPDQKFFITLPAEDWISLFHLRQWMARSVMPDRMNATGINLFRHYAVVWGPLDGQSTLHLLGQKEKEIIEKSLEKLPEVSFRMNEEQRREFIKKFSALPENENINWIPVIPDELDIVGDNAEYDRLVVEYMTVLEGYLKQGRLIARSQRGAPQFILDMGSYLRRDEVVQVLSEMGFEVIVKNHLVQLTHSTEAEAKQYDFFDVRLRQNDLKIGELIEVLKYKTDRDWPEVSRKFAQRSTRLRRQLVGLRNSKYKEELDIALREALDNIVDRWSNEERRQLVEYKKEKTWPETEEEFGVSRQALITQMAQYIEK